MNFFLIYTLFFVSLSSQLSTFHDQTTDGYHQSSKVHGKEKQGSQKVGQQGQKVKARLPDFMNCQSKDSLCDSVKPLRSIESFLYMITRKHPKTTKLIVIGSTHRNLPIYALDIFKGTDPTDCTTAVVEFGMHGREWASHASAEYTIFRLLEQGNNISKTIRWFILPMMNPDGYDHSTTKDNMWKKNRSPLNGSERCYGVDLDRNFEVGWELNSGSDPCKEDYAGPRPFSELESKALRRFIEGLGPFAVDIYVSVHSCGQVILHPYGFTAKEPSQWKLGRFLEAGTIMAKAMKKLRNRNYDVGVAYKFGGFRGTTADYMFDHFHIPYVYTLELGDRMYFEEYNFHHCYHPPTTMQMAYLTKECYAGISALASHVSAMKETEMGRYAPRSFNLFPPITKPPVELIGLVMLLV